MILVFAGWLFPQAAFADAAFDHFIQSLWPDAQRLGVSRATFDAATRGLTPDLSLPDLDIPGKKPPEQPEFVQSPAVYVSERQIDRLAAHARQLSTQYDAALSAIEQHYGVPRNVLLAIWGRETDFGRYKLPNSAVRVLATQAYIGKRKEKFRQEFLLALKILQEGHVKLADMRSSWAGAMGLTQFLPSEFYKYAVDFDRDGKRDIWNSVPDALAAAAGQLKAKGWQTGERWAYEVRAPQNADCSVGVPEVKRAIRDWIAAGFQPFNKLSARELSQEASLLQPEGIYGPSFLTPKNYYVIKEYNFSDLYVLFVGHLADKISGGRAFETAWAKIPQMKTKDVEMMQKVLTAKGIYHDKIDGKAGMLTRAALGQYQKRSGLKLDCWPTADVLRHMQGR
ncbi:MAG TPA: lytic murein transglycosylase [Xanthobacteraceae bacterium]|nr:lytic murein transglycosylase [Xanthobacteraceae bacterium]